MFTITPKKVYDEALVCMRAGLVGLFSGSPGTSKSSVIQQVARDNKLKLIDIRLSQFTPEDLNGLPMRNGNRAEFTPFDTFPIEGDEIPDGYVGWMVFFDEITSAPKQIQAAAYKIILDKMVGNHRLHKNVAMVAAGNLLTDGAVVNKMSTALQSRLIHYEVEVSHSEWMEYAVKNNFDHRILGFLNYLPSRLMDFRPDHQDKTFPCPRTWEFLSKLIQHEDKITPDLGPRIAGTVGQGAATEFLTFAEEYDRIPKFDQIIKAPQSTPVPEEMSTKYATISMLMDRTDEETSEAVVEYMKNFDMELQVVFIRGLLTRNPSLRRTEVIDPYLRKMARYIIE